MQCLYVMQMSVVVKILVSFSQWRYELLWSLTAWKSPPSASRRVAECASASAHLSSAEKRVRGVAHDNFQASSHPLPLPLPPHYPVHEGLPHQLAQFVRSSTTSSIFPAQLSRGDNTGHYNIALTRFSLVLVFLDEHGRSNSIGFGERGDT